MSLNVSKKSQTVRFSLLDYSFSSIAVIILSLATAKIIYFDSKLINDIVNTQLD